MEQENKVGFLEELPLQYYLNDIPYLTMVFLNHIYSLLPQQFYQGSNLSANPTICGDKIRL